MKNTHDYAPIEGIYVNLREVEISDAAFILALRCDEKKSRFLNNTDNNLEKQIDYLKRYKSLDNEWYFIIENKKHEPLGTSRIYNVHDDKYTGGSWLMKDGSLPEETIEGAVLARDMAFNKLGFKIDCFDVRKANKRVVRFHKTSGAKIVGENDVDYFFEMTKDVWNKNKATLLNLL